MKKGMLAVASVALLLGLSAPAHADNTTDLDQLVTQVSLFPARVIGVTAGAGVGVPVATIRATAEKTNAFKQKIADALPDTGSPANKAYSTLLALPAGIVTGLIDGPYYGCVNAAKGYDHPFSSESMSLTQENLTE